MKVTAAACICYFIQAATDWGGISTIVTTCLVTALSTVGETTEKQFLRISGDILGGICALAAIAWIFPEFSTIAGLTAVVAVVALAGAWVFLSSPRLSYGGRQFSYCFFLATLTSASTPTSLTQARDRVAGGVLGVTVMSKCRVQLLEARLHNPVTGSVSVDWTIQQFSDVVTQMHTPLHGPSHNVPY